MKFKVGDVVAVNVDPMYHASWVSESLEKCSVIKITKLDDCKEPSYYCEPIFGEKMVMHIRETEIVGCVKEMNVFDAIDKYIREPNVKHEYQMKFVLFVNMMGIYEGDATIPPISLGKIVDMASEFVFGEYDYVSTYLEEKGIIQKPSKPEAKYKAGDFILISKNDHDHIGGVREYLQKSRVVCVTDTGMLGKDIAYEALTGCYVGMFKEKNIDGTIDDMSFNDILNNYVSDITIGKRYADRFDEFARKISIHWPYSADAIRFMSKEYAFGNWKTVDEYFDYLKKKNENVQ